MELLTRRRVALSAAVVVAFLLIVVIIFRPGEQASAGVDLNDPSAWIEHGIDGELLQINGVTGEVTARITLAESGDRFDSVIHGGGVAVLNHTTGTVSFVDGSRFEVISTANLGLSEGATDRRPLLFGSSNAASDIIVVDEDQLVRVDPQTQVITPSALPDTVRSVLQTDSGDIIALRSDSLSVQKFDDSGAVDIVDLPPPVAGSTPERTLVQAGPSTWLVDPDRLILSEVLDNGTLGPGICLTNASPGVIVGGSAPDDSPTVVLIDPSSGRLGVTDLAGGRCFEITLDLATTNVGTPIVNDGFAYIPNWGSNRC